MRVLVRIPNWIGDAVNAIPVVKNLQNNGFEVSGICHKRVFPVMDGIIPCETFSTRHEAKRISIKLRGRFDWGIVLPNSFSSAFAMWLAHPRKRVGFNGEARDFLLTHVVKKENFWKREHILKSYLRLLHPMGIKPKELVPEVVVREFDLRKFGINDENFVTLSPFANYGPAKEWPLENFIKLAEMLEGEGFLPVFLGGPGDVERSRDLDRFVNLVGRTTLEETKFILKRSKGLISIDSGLSHLGIASGTRVLTIFLSTDPGWTAPFGPMGHWIYNRISCSPCFKKTCPLGHYDCYSSVTPEEVFLKFMKIL